MLLPRTLPFEDAPSFQAGLSDAAALAPSTVGSWLTIDDEPLRDRIGEALAEHPIAFLELVAESMGVLGPRTSMLVRDLIRSACPEGLAVACAIFWLAGAAPPDELLLPSFPDWLVSLDRTSIKRAKRRREGPDARFSIYLLEIALIDGRTGVLYAALDHDCDDVIMSAFAIDAPLDVVLAAISDAERANPQPRSSSARLPQFRAIHPKVGSRALAGALTSPVPSDLPIDLESPWPGIRPLLAFLVLDLAVPTP